MKNETVGGLGILIVAAFLALPHAALAWIATIMLFGVGILALGLAIHTMFTVGISSPGRN